MKTAIPRGPVRATITGKTGVLKLEETCHFSLSQNGSIPLTKVNHAMGLNHELFKI
jgi:hypothetical protein